MIASKDDGGGVISNRIGKDIAWTKCSSLVYKRDEGSAF